MDREVVKICTKCTISKPYKSFHKDKYTKDGHYPSCIDCNKAKRNDKIKKALYDKEYRKHLGWKKKANELKVNVSTLDITYLEQKGLCVICSKPETAKHYNGTQKKLAADHNHSTGAFRAFLCQACNQGLGMFKDNAQLLLNASEYIKKHSL